MELTTIQNEEGYTLILKWVDNQFDYPPLPESPEGVRLQKALTLIKDYEDKYHKIEPPRTIKTKAS